MNKIINRNDILHCPNCEAMIGYFKMDKYQKDMITIEDLDLNNKEFYKTSTNLNCYVCLSPLFCGESKEHLRYKFVEYGNVYFMIKKPDPIPKAKVCKFC